MTIPADAQIGFGVESTYGTAVTPTRFLEFVDESLNFNKSVKQGQGCGLVPAWAGLRGVWSPRLRLPVTCSWRRSRKGWACCFRRCLGLGRLRWCLARPISRHLRSGIRCPR